MEQVTLIEIEQGRPGFDPFIGSWLIQGGHNILVDVGPANSAERLISALDKRGVSTIDYVLLTHIHIDHAGALGKILARYPEAKAICHEKALKYLINPEKLWEGSLDVLGDVARMYGAPVPVQGDRLIPHTQFQLGGLVIIDTPGHAPHHLSFQYKGKLFSGEAGGNYLMVEGMDYLRPATPPRFFLEVFVSSIDKLRTMPDQQICYAHFGWASSSHHMLDRFRQQIFFWAELVETEKKKGGDDLVERCVKRLLKEDKNLAAFSIMGADVKARELNFMANAVKGFVGYFEERS